MYGYIHIYHRFHKVWTAEIISWSTLFKSFTLISVFQSSYESSIRYSDSLISQKFHTKSFLQAFHQFFKTTCNKHSLITDFFQDRKLKVLRFDIVTVHRYSLMKCKQRKFRIIILFTSEEDLGL